jgi:glutamate formiminotransferase
MKLVECVPNFSEGRRKDVIDRIAAAVEGVPGVRLLDVNMDPDYNRAVVTFVGSPDAVAEAAFLAVREAAGLIDMTQHSGEHPRMGATDVLPFVPLQGVTMEECAALAEGVGKRIGDELGIPVYLYGCACHSPQYRNLEDVRRGQYEGLRAGIATSPAKRPDFGPLEMGKAGATAVGARHFLIAFNVNLATRDVSVAKRIARKIRTSSGGLPEVKALGFSLKTRGCVQVSMNLTDYRVTGLQAAFEAVEKEAKAAGVGIAGSELVGLVPAAALAGVDARRLGLALRPGQVLEKRL